MADFRLRSDAEKWFSHISGQPPIRTKFDLYYMCLLVGLAHRRRSRPGEGQSAPAFVDTMPEDFAKTREILAALVLDAEIHRRGYGVEDRNDVRNVLAEIIGPTGLTTSGVTAMNEYASGGFDIMQHHGFSKPYHPQDFLVAFHDFLTPEIL